MSHPVRTSLALLSLAAIGAATLSHRPAAAAASATGNLRSGGTVKGDISGSSGETDTITIDLAEGSSVNMKWSPGFNASLGFFDPAGDPVEIGLVGAREGSVKAWVVPATGTYQFRVSAADSSQGSYSLSVLPYWEKTIVLTGTGETTLNVPMPAAGAIKGKLLPLPGASNPAILSFRSPLGTELLVRPVVGTAGIARLSSSFCPDAGVYRITATATQGTKGFQATLIRRTRKLPRVTIDISNGIDPVSFKASGLEQYFSQRCANCHDWARTYAGTRAFAVSSLSRMKAGNMPKGAPRADAQTNALLGDWIKSGYGR